MDSIYLHDIDVWTHIGVPDKERGSAQQLKVSVELFHSTKETAEKDNVDHGIDYATVVTDILKLAKGERKTVETFAEHIATHIIKKFKPEGGVKVSVRKKPLLPIESVSVTIQRP